MAHTKKKKKGSALARVLHTLGEVGEKHNKSTLLGKGGVLDRLKLKSAK